MPNFFQNAFTLAPSYVSSFLQPNLGKTKFSQESMFGDFLSNAGTEGFGYSQRFLVYIEGPWLDDKFKFRSSQMDKRLMLRAFSVNVPSKYLSTNDRDISGPKRRVPYTASFDDDLTIQFYCAPDMTEYGFFQRWVDAIINPVSRYVSFYDDYAKDTKITLVFVPNNYKTIQEVTEALEYNELHAVRFTEVYPRTFNYNGGTVEWGANTKPGFVNVSFAFREAVDTTTYDDTWFDEMNKLEEVEPGVAAPTAVNGKVKTPVDIKAEQIYGGMKSAVKGAVNKLFNIPSSGTPIASNGSVVQYTPPPPGNGIGA